MNYFTLDKRATYPLIKDVVVRPLITNKDKRGVLVETLKANWKDVFGKNLPFGQTYFSITKPNTARDENQWHIHPTKQTDRFVVIKGNIVVALFDNRRSSPTYQQLNLFKIGEAKGNNGNYLLLIPTKILHCFLAVGKTEAIIANYPTTLYDSKEEGRVAFNQIKLKDGSYFNWNLIRKEFNLDEQKN